jgi:hypothetical protein
LDLENKMKEKEEKKQTNEKEQNTTFANNQETIID